MTHNLNDLEFYRVRIGCTGQVAPVWSLIVRLATDSGLEGWGEARVGWRPAEMPARRDALLPLLVGRSIFDIEDLLSLDALASAPLRSALEMASWDLIGRATRQPICHLFGGGYRDRISLAVRLSGSDPQEAACLGRELAGKGYHTQVIASTGSLEADVALVDAVRESAHEWAELRFDAAGAYSFDDARDLCMELEGDLVQYVIDPLPPAELESTAALRRQTTVPIAICRGIQSPADVLAVIRCGAARTVILDLDQVGGILRARKCAAVAEAGGISGALCAGPSLGISVAAMLQLAAAMPVMASCHECSYHQLQDDLFCEPLDIVDGTVAVPRGPGLGIEVDRAKLERYQVTT